MRPTPRTNEMNLVVDQVQPNLVCLSVDVEWANAEVLADLVRLLDERELPATFFCTHAGIDVPGHERALHPNFRRSGETLQRLLKDIGPALHEWTDTAIYQHVIEATHTFCPEAIGVRAHALFYDCELFRIYRQAGLEYDSTYFLPMAPGLRPIWKEYDILEMPIYYADDFDLIGRVTEFHLKELHLHRPGMKVFIFHPNIVFINASTKTQYLYSKRCYHDYDGLLKLRYPGRGARSLFLELMDFIAERSLPTATLGEVNAAWRRGSGKYVEEARHNVAD